MRRTMPSAVSLRINSNNAANSTHQRPASRNDIRAIAAQSASPSPCAVAANIRSRMRLAIGIGTEAVLSGSEDQAIVLHSQRHAEADRLEIVRGDHGAIGSIDGRGKKRARNQTSRNLSESTPDFRISAKASPRLSMTVVIRKFAVIFTRLAAGASSPTTNVFCPMASNKGRQRAI